MKKTLLRLLGLGLAMVMLLGFLPIGVSAADTTPKIGVSTPGSDDIGPILTSMGIAFDDLNYSDWYTYENLKQYYAIFLNCLGNGYNIEDEVLTRYVNEGGLVYASDLTDSQITSAFPGKLEFVYAQPQTVANADIVDKALQTQMDKAKMDVIFDLSGWAVITGISEDVEVYIRGDVTTYEIDYDTYDYKEQVVNRPLAISFKHGAGKVFYTSFHNRAQASGDMKKFLEYLIFNISLNENNETMSKEAAKKGFKYVGPVFGSLNPGQTSATFTYKATAGKDFMLMLSSSDGDFSIALKDPNGKAYNPNAAQGFSASAIIRTITVANPIAGDWTFTVTSNNAVNGAMFAVGIAETDSTQSHTHTPGDWEITKAATSSEPGEKVKKCTVCGTVLESEPIPATGGGTSGKTIFGTGRPATFLNWILFFVCFGWIWMWF